MRPNVLIIPCPDQLGGDPYLGTVLPNASFQNIADLKLSGDLPDTFIGIFELSGGSAGNHPKVFKLGQIGQNILYHTFTKEGLLFSSVILKRQYGYGGRQVSDGIIRYCFRAGKTLPYSPARQQQHGNQQRRDQPPGPYPRWTLLLLNFLRSYGDGLEGSSGSFFSLPILKLFTVRARAQPVFPDKVFTKILRTALSGLVGNFRNVIIGLAE